MEVYVGLDVSKEETNFCVMDAPGKFWRKAKWRVILNQYSSWSRRWPLRRPLTLLTGEAFRWPKKAAGVRA